MSYRVFIQNWFQEKGQKLLSTSAFLMMAGLSFVGGTLFQKDHTVEEPKLVITVPDYEAKKQILIEEQKGTVPIPAEPTLAPVVKGEPSSSVIQEESQTNCPYVGSKNSDKYHSATCGVVKRIKPENRRCFASPQVAEASGYSQGCVK